MLRRRAVRLRYDASLSTVVVFFCGRDVLWVRALGALPDELRSALCAAELDDPWVLCEYPTESRQYLEEFLGGSLEKGGAPSGAASTSHLSFSSLATSSVSIGPNSSWTGLPARAGDTGTGGVPKTDQTTLSDCLSKAYDVEMGGDARTDLSLHSKACVDADSPQSGGLATQTAISATVSPALDPDVALTLGSELRDEYPSILQDPDHRDGFPSSAEVSENRDGLPRSGEMAMNPSSDNADTVFSLVFHSDEKSEGVRQSDSRVQIVPASGSPSELSAHQMGASLAGKVRFSSSVHNETDSAHPDGFSRLRLKSEPTDPVPFDGSSSLAESAEGMFSEHCGGSQSQGIDIGTTVILDAEATEFLSISDRALLRRSGSLETAQKNFHQVGDSRLEVSTSVSRVDGHPLKCCVNLLDRALLRRFPDTVSASSSLPCTKQPEDSLPSSAASIVPSHPGEVAKETMKRKKINWEREHEESRYLSRCPRQSFAETGTDRHLPWSLDQGRRVDCSFYESFFSLSFEANSVRFCTFVLYTCER